jgi:hypothetical protein
LGQLARHGWRLFRPSPGAGSSGTAAVERTFVVNYADPVCYDDVSSFNFEFGQQGLAANSCILTYYPSINGLDLWNDAASGTTGGAPGVSTPLGNSQCSIDLAHTSVVGSGSASGGTGALVFTLAVTFSATFEGSQEMWSLGVNSAGVYSPWMDLGAYTVTAASIWPASAVANTWDSASLTVGVKFQSSLSGNITGIRYYSGVAPSGTQIGLLYSVSGTLLGQATFTGGTALGWQQVSFATPVAIAANTTYVAAYFSSTGFAYSSGYFTSAGVTNPPLQALQYETSSPNVHAAPCDSRASHQASQCLLA